MANVFSVSKKGVPSIADKASRDSVAIAASIFGRLKMGKPMVKPAGQQSGREFEKACQRFIERTFLALGHLRPGTFEIWAGGKGKRTYLGQFEQYLHLTQLRKATQDNRELRAILGIDYLISPDIVVLRIPEPDDVINGPANVVDADVASHAALRRSVCPLPLVHASISCKLTMRSDRAQNARTEALNLIRNRKGRTPHMVVVTAEPLPSRLASLALGTGDIDCVYHIALPELQAAVGELTSDTAKEFVEDMVVGKRLKDIADLPLDLSV